MPSGGPAGLRRSRRGKSIPNSVSSSVVSGALLLPTRKHVLGTGFCTWERDGSKTKCAGSGCVLLSVRARGGWNVQGEEGRGGRGCLCFGFYPDESAPKRLRLVGGGWWWEEGGEGGTG